MAVNIRPTLCIESEGLQNETYTATRPFRVYDVHGVVTTQGGGTTTTVQRGATPVSSALNDDVVPGTLGRTTSIATAQDDFAVGDVLNFTNSGAGRQIVYVAIIPRPITGA